MASKKKGRSSKGSSAKQIEAAAPVKSGFSPSNIRDFIQEVKVEFGKVVWPVKKVTVGLTGFVLLLVVVISIYLGSVDLLLGKLVAMILQ
ncbi:MAG: preprotein translocase subunit SecE [Desulfobulbaceae bacterium]|nr:preprotein translocase subunit SecE [Desulfobulbaceae bacterium]